jgi:phage shock protein A
MPWRSKPDLAVPEEAPEPTAGDELLAQRLEELTHREVALRRITEVVERQRTRLEERERALQSSASTAAADADKRLAKAVRRAEHAEGRVGELERQVVSLEQQVGSLEQQVGSLAEQVAELEEQVAELEARPEPTPPDPEVETAIEPAPEVVPAPRTLEPGGVGEATYTLQRLERLVHEAQLRGDPQAEEWAYYLPLLREHAEPDGRLPAQFAALVDSIFAA